jgi:hypothetical protein
MDEKLYYPGKTLQGTDSVKYEDVNLSTDTVQLNVIFLRPAVKPRQLFSFFMVLVAMFPNTHL